MSKLYDDASLMMIPSSVKDGKLYSILPQPKVIGDNILTEPLDIDADFNTNGGGVIVDANTFTTAGGSLDGIISAVLVVGKNYKLEIKGTTTSNGFTIGNGTASGNEYGSGFGVHYFTAANASLWIRQNTAGTTDITTFTIKEVDQLPADFDFSRGADRATRVNEQGLVRPVEIVSDELVQNGDFEEIGSEEVTNGGFDDSSTWIIPSGGWSIGNGVASCDGSNSRLIYQNLSNTTTSDIFKVTYSVSNYVSGSVQVGFGSGLLEPTGTVRNSNGTYTEYIQKTSTSLSFGFKSTSFVGSIDNVSVKEVGQNWTLTSGSSFTENGIRIQADGTYENFSQDNVMTVGKTYKVTYEVTEVNSGGIKFNTSFGLNSVTSTLGVHSIYATANIINLFFERNGVADITIDNISVVEVTEATDLPRLDWSGECPSLLLEPQRTNLVTHSEKVDEYSNSNTICTSNYSLSPEGVNNSTKVRFISSSTNSLGQDISVSSGDSVTQSIFVKYIDTQFVQLWFGSSGFAGGHANFDLINNQTSSYSGASSSIESFGNGWYRISTTKQASSSNSNTKGFALVAVDSLTSLRFNDEVDGSVEVFGAQAEQGSYPTSYIPTRGQSATRAKDDIVEKADVGVTREDFTILFDIDLNNTVLSSNVRVLDLKDSSGTAQQEIRFFQFGGEHTFVPYFREDSTYAFGTGDNDMRFDGRVIFRADGGGSYSMFFGFNGVSTKKVATGLTPYVLNKISFVEEIITIGVKELTIWNTALSDNECINLTSI